MLPIRLDPFHFGKNQPKSWKIFTKVNQNHNIISYIIFEKKLNFCLKVINIYLINNKTSIFLGNIFLIEKKVKKKLVFGSGSVIQRNGSEDPDPDQNETDPQHC